jgi:hypothetical protein
MMIKNQIFKFRETARRQPEIRIRFGCGGKKSKVLLRDYHGTASRFGT